MIPEKDFEKLWLKFHKKYPECDNLSFDEFYLKFMGYVIENDPDDKLISKNLKEYIQHIIQYGKSQYEEFTERNNQ